MPIQHGIGKYWTLIGWNYQLCWFFDGFCSQNASALPSPIRNTYFELYCFFSHLLTKSNVGYLEPSFSNVPVFDPGSQGWLFGYQDWHRVDCWSASWRWKWIAVDGDFAESAHAATGDVIAVLFRIDIIVMSTISAPGYAPAGQQVHVFHALHGSNRRLTSEEIN